MTATRSVLARIAAGALRVAAIGWLVTFLAAPGMAAAGPRATAQVGNLILEAPPRYRGEVERLADFSVRLLPRLEANLGQRARHPFRIVLIPEGPLDAELRAIDALAPRSAAGFLVGSARLGAIRLGQVRGYPWDDLPSVLAHEVTHQLLHDAAGRELPRWFSEGVATFEGRKWGMRDFTVQSTALLSARLPRLAQLEDEFERSPTGSQRAYAASFDFVRWSERKYGPGLIARVLDEASANSFEDAWTIATGVPLAQAESRWRRATLWWHRWLPVVASSGSLWLGITLLALVAGVSRQRRTRALYRQWAAEDSPPVPEPGSSDPPPTHWVH